MNWYRSILQSYWTKLAAVPQSDNNSDDEWLNDFAKPTPPKREPLGKQVFKHFGVWQYPFQLIAPANGEGWVINWFDNPGGIHDLDDVSVGDKIADDKLNMTPYWEVSGIDEHKGHIFLSPLPNNMWVTGIGAGGAKITDYDREVASGDNERKHVDNMLQRVRQRSYSSPGDIAYLLKGTIPVHVGPNGSQGGWYACQDYHCRGQQQQNMSAEEIVQADATAMKRMGFDVPPAALDGRMTPNEWTDYVNGRGEPFKNPNHLVAGESVDDPQTMVRFVLNHPEPEIKKRSLEALSDLADGRRILKQQQRSLYKSNLSDDQIQQQYEELLDSWNAGKMQNPDAMALLKDVITKLPSLQHPRVGIIGYDPYYSVKEKGMYLSKQYQLPEALAAYEHSQDNNVRHGLIGIYRGEWDKPETVNKEGLLRMLATEKGAENTKDILSALSGLGVDISQFVRQNPKHYAQMMAPAAEDTYAGYYAKQLYELLQAKVFGPEARAAKESGQPQRFWWSGLIPTRPV